VGAKKINTRINDDDKRCHCLLAIYAMIFTVLSVMYSLRTLCITGFISGFIFDYCSDTRHTRKINTQLI